LPIDFTVLSIDFARLTAACPAAPPTFGASGSAFCKKPRAS
jgi:hypothetical protein